MPTLSSKPSPRASPPAAPTSGVSRYRVQVLARAMRIMEVLAREGLELGPTELAGHLSLHKSTIHRLLVVLEDHGLVVKNPLHGKYRLGMKLFELGTRAVAHLDLRSQAIPF